MKQKITLMAAICLSLLLYGNNSYSQNSASNHDYIGSVILNAYVPEQAGDMPELARKTLEDKLSLIASLNGVGRGTDMNNFVSPRFIITANIVVISKDITSTAPPMTAYNLEVHLYIGDGFDGKKFAAKTMLVKGIGTNESKAYMDAIKNIKADDPAIQRFVTEGRDKIIDYYNTQCDLIIKEAQVLASRNDYVYALDKLGTVPEDCKACFDKCINASIPIYKKYIDLNCQLYLTNAKAQWAASPDANGAAAAAGILGTINPDASCYKEVKELIDEIAKTMKQYNTREWELKMKIENDRVQFAKEMINIFKEMAVSKTKRKGYNTKGW